MSPKSLQEQPGTAPEQQKARCSRITVPGTRGPLGPPPKRPEQRTRRGRAKGFVSTHRKLTDEQAAEIRYRVGGLRQLSERKAAIEYGVSTKTIRGILAGNLYTKPRPPKAEPEPDVLPPPVRPVLWRPAPVPDISGRSYSLAPSRRSA